MQDTSRESKKASLLQRTPRALASLLRTWSRRTRTAVQTDWQHPGWVVSPDLRSYLSSCICYHCSFVSLGRRWTLLPMHTQGCFRCFLLVLTRKPQAPSGFHSSPSTDSTAVSLQVPQGPGLHLLLAIDLTRHAVSKRAAAMASPLSCLLMIPVFFYHHKRWNFSF